MIHLTAVCLILQSAEVPLRFEGVVVDSEVGIGYGVAAADVDGDGRNDLLLADKDVIVWYQNPEWQKHVIARKLTELDHVCIAARDLDGDGKAELAAGAGWNPSDTEASGSIHFLARPSKADESFTAIAIPHEPTVHRMRWVQTSPKQWALLVAPLHGRGNKDGQGAGVRILAYEQSSVPMGPWQPTLVDETLHVTHNFDVVQWDEDPEEELLVAAREGLFRFDCQGDHWIKRTLVSAATTPEFAGASEVRRGTRANGRAFLVTVEPFHGQQLVLYETQEQDSQLFNRRVLAADLEQAHALACGDLLGTGSDQIVVGWRNKNPSGKVGIRMYASQDSSPQAWISTLIDDDTMACEDLCLCDLDRDGRLDVIAAGRDTHNLKIYFNRKLR